MAKTKAEKEAEALAAGGTTTPGEPTETDDQTAKDQSENSELSQAEKDKQVEAQELTEMENLQYKFPSTKEELAALGVFLKNARIPDGVQMSRRDKMEAETAAQYWYAKTQKTVNAS